MNKFQTKVAPEDVTETVNNGIAQGWQFIKSELQPDGKLLLTFDTVNASTPIPSPAKQPRKKQSVWNSLMQLSLLLVIVCVCLVLAINSSSEDKKDSSASAPNTPRSTAQPVGPQPAPTREIFTQADLPQQVSAIMEDADFDVTRITVSDNVVTSYAPPDSEAYDEVRDYRTAYVVALAGALINFFDNPNTDAEPPQTVVINFGVGNQVVVRVTYNYADALAFYNGTITANQFVARWEVE